MVRDRIERFTVDESALRLFYYVRTSLATEKRLSEFLSNSAERLAALDFDSLPPDGRIDYVLLDREIRWRQRRLAQRRTERTAWSSLAGFLEPLIALEESRWRGESPDPASAAKTLDSALEALRAHRRELEKQLADAKKKKDEGANGESESPQLPDSEAAENAANAIDDVRRALNNWFENQDGYLPAFSWWVKKPYDTLKGELDRYRDFLRKELGRPRKRDELSGNPIGREELEASLAYELIAYSPEELIELAEHEFEWCRRERKRAAAELGFAGDPRAALEHVKTLHVPPGKQAELIYEQAHEAIRFVDERDLVTIPALCRETWRYEMISEQGQRTLPYAAYGGQKMLVAYPTEAMEHSSKLMSMRGNNIHFTRIVTPHELVPGHHLQGFMAARHNTHRRRFSTPFLVEGWALYWEMLLWDLGYPRGPEDRIGMLFWRMHRCARIIVSLKFHLGEMTPQEMIDFLVEEVGHERDGATSEVRRYIGDSYGPLYQCAYMVGGQQLRALRREVVESGRMTDRQFHDAVLRQNAISIELIRARLLDLPLARGYRASWKFYPGDLRRRTRL